MTDKKKMELSRGRVAAIITAAVVGLLVIVLIVINIFIPIKYLSAYFVGKDEREEDTLRVTFIDVGYGDSTLCEFPDGKVMLIDGGDGSYANNLAILTVLNERGVNTIDYLVCTSVLGEYCGGLDEVISSFKKEIKHIFMPAVSNVYINEEYAEFVDAAAASEAEISYCEYGAGAVGEDYFFTFLSPSSPDDPKGYYAALDKSATEENMLNASAVIWLEYCGTSFAFTSSAGKAALESIVDSYDIMTAAGDEYAPIHGYPIDLSDCDIVSVPGHGREECSSPKWYQTLSPSLAVISVGENYSGYPSAQALADISSVVNFPILTSKHGDITIIVDKDGYTLGGGNNK